MHYIVVDLEATCWHPRNNKPNEIIEIGAVCIAPSGETVSSFEQIVQPILHPVLSDFCTELTTITQAMVDAAPTFPTACAEFLAWQQSCGAPRVLCSWGHYDRKQLQQDSALHDLPTGWLTPHFSVKHQYATLQALRRPIGMRAALAREGLSLDGTHHRGIDDARNISKIVVKYLTQWRFEE